MDLVNYLPEDKRYRRRMLTVFCGLLFAGLFIQTRIAAYERGDYLDSSFACALIFLAPSLFILWNEFKDCPVGQAIAGAFYGITGTLLLMPNPMDGAATRYSDFEMNMTYLLGALMVAAMALCLYAPANKNPLGIWSPPNPNDPRPGI